MGGSAAPTGSEEPVASYPLGIDMAVTISRDESWPGGGWRCTVRRKDGDGWRDTVEGDGAAEAFVDVLRHTVTVPAEGFRLIRLVPPPEATGERSVDTDQTNDSVVVGERVVVKWVHHLNDLDHPAPLTLAHLAEVRFFGVPVTHGLLTWRSPGGNELPCAVVTGYLPRARDGWVWCPDLVEQQLGVRASRDAPDAAGLGAVTGSIPVLDSWIDDFPARIGRLAAKLHVALATPSRLISEPVHRVGADTVRHWHSTAKARLDQIAEVVREGVLEDAAHVLRPRLEALGHRVDGLQELASELPEDPDEIARKGIVVQRIHGDLHAGQLLRWPGGMAVVDFDGNPVLTADPATAIDDPITQPAARDLAQLLLSIDYVGRVADKRADFRHTDEVDAWSHAARAQLLTGYRSELAHVGREDLLDDRLLPAFEAEQVCRELLYAVRHLPRWAYAPLAGLRLMIPAVEESGFGRHRASAS